MSREERFEHPLIDRYAGREMARLFSPRSRHGKWRELWIALAESQMRLGLPVTEEQGRRVVSIPVRPGLTDEEIEFIVETLNGVFE